MSVGAVGDRLDIVTATARFIPEVVPSIIVSPKLGVGGSQLSCLDSNELEVRLKEATKLRDSRRSINWFAAGSRSRHNRAVRVI